METSSRIWISKLTLTDFRNYRAATITVRPAPVVLVGANGAGKTNCLEAVSLLTAGRGLRSLPFSDLGRSGGSGGWAIAARVSIAGEDLEIGTGVQPSSDGIREPPRRPHREDRSRYGEGLGRAGAGAHDMAHARNGWPFYRTRQRSPPFLDRLVLSLEPSYAGAAAAFDRAMRQRNKALEQLGRRSF